MMLYRAPMQSSIAAFWAWVDSLPCEVVSVGMYRGPDGTVRGSVLGVPR
jgi:hypothetical protein